MLTVELWNSDDGAAVRSDGRLCDLEDARLSLLAFGGVGEVSDTTMPKRPLKLKVRIPRYAPARNTWREAIYEAVAKVQQEEGVSYDSDDRLEVELRLYFTNDRAREIHDVDNRLKDCLDALQGRVEEQRPKRGAHCRPLCQTTVRYGAW